MYDLLFGIVLPAIGILVLGVLIGGARERRHFQDLARREQDMRQLLVTNLKTIPSPHNVKQVFLVTGSVVIASDMFKTFAIRLRSLIGGEMRAALSLMTRARREALLRALEQASRHGATEVWNVRYGTCTIGQLESKKKSIQVEVFAWATAVIRMSPPAPPAAPVEATTP